MKALALVLCFALLSCGTSKHPVPPPATAVRSSTAVPWPAGLPVYDHVVIVVEENKSYEQIIGSAAAPCINSTLKAEGANLTQMYAEEHFSQGNYFWLFSGSNQNVGFFNRAPEHPITASNLAQQLVRTQHSFKGYSESLPSIGWRGSRSGLYVRKHVPWASFSNLPSGATVVDSSHLRFEDFPADYDSLPTVAFVVPNLAHDMHNGSAPASIKTGDSWLCDRLGGYYNWAKQHNSLLIVTFDENNGLRPGLTDPGDPSAVRKNRIATILAGAHIKPGDYAEGSGVTHVNLLRTLEAMYGLERSGAQQRNAAKAGISDDFIITDVFAGKP
ncbi:MAG TPA: alkaline phosphatase family protein [Alphaproteobacteria bacterium]|nr:alkaline phosphatase family protein [Alphaproteobacteria bacterium]